MRGEMNWKFSEQRASTTSLCFVNDIDDLFMGDCTTRSRQREMKQKAIGLLKR